MESTPDWSVYIARCADGSLYTGIARDVRARLAVHNAGRGAAYTRPRRPLRLVYREEGMTRSAALSREAGIKALDRQRKLSLVKTARKTLATVAVLLLAAAAHAVPTFDKEDPIVFSSANPQAFTGSLNPGNLKMFFIRPSSAGPVEVGTALSADGVSWTEETRIGRLSTATVPSVSASTITGCGVLRLSGGGYRMLYSIVSTTGNYRIHSATSADGLAWTNDSGTRLDNGTTYLTSPKLVKLLDSSWRMYYVGNSGAGISNRRVFSVRSTDEGLTWNTPTIVLSTVAYEIGVNKLTNGRIRLFYSQPLSGASSATVILSALSSDSSATTFSIESGYRISTAAASGTVGFPVPAITTDSFRWRLYYNFFDPGMTSTADIHSGLTGAPAPTSLSPSSVLNVQSTVSFTVSGEIFSLPAPTAYLSMAGQPNIIASGMSRTDDQTLTMTFNVLDQAVGQWDLTVTNADNRLGTLSRALFIDYSAGSVALINNLLRPRNGVPTSITITTFANGHITAKIFSMDGRPVRTLFDADQSRGVLNLSWDGLSATGGTVSSGVYVLRVMGPRVDVKNKIVLIR